MEPNQRLTMVIFAIGYLLIPMLAVASMASFAERVKQRNRHEREL